MSRTIEYFFSTLKCQGVPVFRDISLAPFTAFAVGGNADLLSLPRNCKELFIVLELAEYCEFPLLIIGGGANILISDIGVRGVVLSLRYLNEVEWVRPDLLRADAGWDVSALCCYAARHNASGLHYFYGMPGNLGGAVYMNARCYGGEIAEIVRRVQCIPILQKDRKSRKKQETDREASDASEKLGVQANFYHLADLCWVDLQGDDWNYKYSHFQKDSGHKLAGALIIAVELELREQSQMSLEGEMQSFLEDRIVKGHFRLPSGGSFFKNNHTFNAPTGQIIDGLGLKGRRFGKAQLAPWHGNIIVNTGNASAGEIWQLACIVREEVWQRTGFRLEAEVQRLGDW